MTNFLKKLLGFPETTPADKHPLETGNTDDGRENTDDGHSEMRGENDSNNNNGGGGDHGEDGA